jgi:hypothetical protein
MKNILFTLSSILLIILIIFFSRNEEPVDFSADVKPILNKHCISCHGGVKKNGGFSLLFEQEAFAVNDSGFPAIVPGNPHQSEMIKRLMESDPELRMPYNKAPLSADEIEVLKKWIKQGAKWGKHWAYVPVQKSDIPKAIKKFEQQISPSPVSNLDKIVFKKLKAQGFQPAPQAEKMQLLRRLALDITGLPPSQELVEKWRNDQISYEALVDEMLSLLAYGEKWASWWLDLARYADSKGYERDQSRTIWPYRDWVIRALNEDMPFDQFTIEQLAGDLLPEPSKEQLIATAFHRNTMNNDEGGTEDEEFRVAAVLDRVNTTYEVWQSTTMACVQCHSHPYDPFYHEDYFRSMAFFNNSRDEDTTDEEPKIRLYEVDDQEKLKEIQSWLSQFTSTEMTKSYMDFLIFQEPKYHAHLATDFVNGELIDTKWLGLWPKGSAFLKNVYTGGADRLLLNYWSNHDGTKMTIRNGGPEGEILSQFNIDQTGATTRSILFKQVYEKIDLFISAENPRIGTQQATAAISWFAFLPKLPGDDSHKHQHINDYYSQMLNKRPLTVPIMIENPSFMQRKTHVFERGNWMLHGEEVQAITPESLNPWKKEWTQDRMGFALWLTDESNPLTARTTVNRVWDQLFGQGLVSTLEDMGTQSDPPVHRELLDFLAWELMYTHQWSIKQLIKEIVLSHTYRQGSGISPQQLAEDPENRWLARGPRFRLGAETVRDQALASAGLLSDKMYGKSVMPPQPDGIWETVYSGEYWKESEGEDKYRRGIYTYLKRTSPYPSFISFDAGSREVCQGKRIVTNTPLQALVTLNDPVFFEAAADLGKRMLDLNAMDPGKAIADVYEQILYQKLSEGKQKFLVQLYQEALEEFEFEKSPLLPADLTDSQRKSWGAFTVVGNAMLNLDEFLTKP